MTSFADQLARGQGFENAVRRWFEADAWQYAFAPPDLGHYDLPDLLFMTSEFGVPCFIDAKLKTHVSRGDTGMDWAQWLRYCELARGPGEPAVIIIHGVETLNEVRMIVVGVHAARYSPGFNHGKGGAFWKWDDLPRIGYLSDMLGDEPMQLNLLGPGEPQPPVRTHVRNHAADYQRYSDANPEWKEAAIRLARQARGRGCIRYPGGTKGFARDLRRLDFRFDDHHNALLTRELEHRDPRLLGLFGFRPLGKDAT